MTSVDAMPTGIQKKDKVRFKDGKCRKYGTRFNADDVFTVTNIDTVQGRKRLYAIGPNDDIPTLIWSGDAKLAWGKASKERREALGY